MRLRFEDWLDQQTFSADSRRLFGEAIVCFKAGAYRAALLFSFLGFQSVLRDRLLRAPAPNGFVSGRWTSLQRDLRDEDRWDAAVFDQTQQRNPEVFVLSDDIRSQVTYWKNRRNDCAHGKDDNISDPHVEGFWLFLESRLPRFVVNGSRVQLVERIRKHFDRSVTPAGRSISQLATEVPSAIPTSELHEFFEEADGILEDNDDPFSGDELPDIAFFGTLLDLDNDKVNAHVIDFLAERPHKLLKMLESGPPRVRHLRGRDAQTRKLWYGDGTRLGCSHRLLASLLAEGIIPQDQQDEAVRRAARHLSDTRLTPEIGLTLQQFGFDQQFRQVAFVDGYITQFSWANVNSQNVVDYLKRNRLDGEVVARIAAAFDVHNHPYTLKAALNRLFLEDVGLRTEFNRILAEQGATPPRYLAGLSGKAEEDDAGVDDA